MQNFRQALDLSSDGVLHRRNRSALNACWCFTICFCVVLALMNFAQSSAGLCMAYILILCFTAPLVFGLFTRALACQCGSYKFIAYRPYGAFLFFAFYHGIGGADPLPLYSERLDIHVEIFPWEAHEIFHVVSPATFEELVPLVGTFPTQILQISERFRHGLHTFHCVACRTKVWVRDLTEEGIEPHPGPKFKPRNKFVLIGWNCTSLNKGSLSKMRTMQADAYALHETHLS